jgi:hypothetical protein
MKTKIKCIEPRYAEKLERMKSTFDNEKCKGNRIL